MSLLDLLFGRAKVPKQQRQPSPQHRPQHGPQQRQLQQGYRPQYQQQYGKAQRQPLRRLRQGRPPGRARAEQALNRYHYILRTASVETIEQAYADAFAKLTPEQCRILLEQLNANVPANERAAGMDTHGDPASLARMATRVEIRRPGTLERIFGSMNAAPAKGVCASGTGKGTFSADSFMNTFTWLFLGSMAAQQFLGDSMYVGFDARAAAGYDAADYGSAGPAGDFGGDFDGGAT